MPLDEQCDRLPYDSSKWEFPRDRLRLGEWFSDYFYKEWFLMLLNFSGSVVQSKNQPTI